MYGNDQKTCLNPNFLVFWFLLFMSTKRNQIYTDIFALTNLYIIPSFSQIILMAYFTVYSDDSRPISALSLLSPPKWTKWTLEEIKKLVYSLFCVSVYTLTHHRLYILYTTGRNGGALLWKLLHFTIVMFKSHHLAEICTLTSSF